MMTRLMKTIVATAMLAGGVTAVSTPAIAQGTGRLEVTVYGSDPCPRSTESQVVICQHRPENERYRLPKNQQLQGTRQQRESWANKSKQLMTAGNTGVGSCSAVGPGGREGCLVQEINRDKQDAQEQQQSDQAPPRL
jgi:hypothetical protein